MDDDRNGTLTRAEYLQVMAAKDFRSLRQELAGFIAPESEEKERPGFNELDKNNDGKVSHQEAQANSVLAQRWQDTDDDNDGFVTRMEYLKTMAAVDWQNARENIAQFVGPGDKPSAGGSKPAQN